MKKEQRPPLVFNTIAELNEALGLPKPLHPLVCVNNCKDMHLNAKDIGRSMILNMYKVSYKKYFTGKLRYGQTFYDFDEGGLCFFAPGQLIGESEPGNYDGLAVLIHPDLIRNYPLGKSIKNYGFFSYSASEALHLSEKERGKIFDVFNAMQEELEMPIDQFSQDVIVSQIELLLNYSNRFYNRQFITRKAAHHDLLSTMETLLSNYFDTEKAFTEGLPTVQLISDQLKVSPRYLSDMLRTLTGQNAQQHIHNKLIEKAKDILVATNLTVAEIAYQLGFEHPQSFNKVFKRKTNISPVEFRQSFN